MHADPFEPIDPPPGARDRLRPSLVRRAQRRRRRRATFSGAVVLAALALLWLRRSPQPDDGPTAAPAVTFDPALHPALAIGSGASLPAAPAAVLRGGGGALVPRPTRDRDLVLYELVL